MKELKVSEGDFFSHQFFVNYSDISSKGTLRPSAAVNYFQSLAVMHSDAAGYNLDWFREQSRGWVLLSWHIVFGNMPKEGTALQAETWARAHKRSQADREFSLVTSDGDILVRAASRWVLMNTARRRPAKLDQDFFDSYLFENGRECDDEDYIIDFPDEAEKINSFSIPVMRRDTDTNRHANNAVYIDWALDGVPDEIYDNYDLSEMIVLYKKECRRGNMARIDIFKNKNDLLAVITDDNDPSAEFGRVFMTWTCSSQRL